MVSIKTPEQLVLSTLSSLNTYTRNFNPKEENNTNDDDVDQDNDNLNENIKTQPLSSSSASSIDDTHSVAEDELQKSLNQMKTILYGDNKTNIVDEEKAIELANLCIEHDLIVNLIQHIDILPFEARKDTAHIFNNLIRKNICDFPIYVHENYEQILFQLVKCYGKPEAALSCGSMLRECIRFDELANRLLYSEYLWCFFDDYVHLRNFEIASDSFNTLRDLLTTPTNKSVSAAFLQSNYESVMLHYDKLLKSDNFVTRWRSLKLLADLLLDRCNFSLMMRYIASKDNLKTIMNMLRDKSPNIQFEAFHVFKVFVANPNKPNDIALVLYKNKDKLITFLNNFYSDKEDAQFNEEKCLLIETLSHLTKPITIPLATLSATTITTTTMTTNSDLNKTPMSQAAVVNETNVPSNTMNNINNKKIN